MATRRKGPTRPKTGPRRVSVGGHWRYQVAGRWASKATYDAARALNQEAQTRRDWVPRWLEQSRRYGVPSIDTSGRQPTPTRAVGPGGRRLPPGPPNEALQRLRPRRQTAATHLVDLQREAVLFVGDVPSPDITKYYSEVNLYRYEWRFLGASGEHMARKLLDNLYLKRIRDLRATLVVSISEGAARERATYQPVHTIRTKTARPLDVLATVDDWGNNYAPFKQLIEATEEGATPAWDVIVHTHKKLF